VITPVTAASTLVRARSHRQAQTAWAALVGARGETGAFRELAAHSGGSDRAHQTLRRHGIATDLG